MSDESDHTPEGIPVERELGQEISPEDEALDATATPLCPHCLAESRPQADFCDRCGAPIGAFATYDPLKQIYATGWMYRRAASEGTPAIAFWGMWLIIGPSAFLTVPAVIHLVRYGSGGNAMLAWAVGLAGLWLYGAILFRVTRSYLRGRRRRTGRCEKCAYDLRGLPEPCCPECGTPFDPESIDEEESPLTR